MGGIDGPVTEKMTKAWIKERKVSWIEEKADGWMNGKSDGGKDERRCIEG